MEKNSIEGEAINHLRFEKYFDLIPCLFIYVFGPFHARANVFFFSERFEFNRFCLPSLKIRKETKSI